MIHSWSFCIRSKIFFTHHPLCYIRIDKKGNKFHSLNGFHNLKRKGGDVEMREGKETLTTNSSVAHNHNQLMMKVNILFLQTSRRNWTMLMLCTDLIDKFLYNDRKQWEEAGFFTFVFLQLPLVLLRVWFVLGILYNTSLRHYCPLGMDSERIILPSPGFKALKMCYTKEKRSEGWLAVVLHYQTLEKSSLARVWCALVKKQNKIWHQPATPASSILCQRLRRTQRV